MDERNLKKILQDAPTPAPDENARKRAVNLALAAFGEEQKKSQNSTQGLGLLQRLIGKSTQTRSNPMERATKKKLVYGGMATAMAVVLVAGVSLQQLQNYNAPEAVPTVGGSSALTIDETAIVAPPGTEQATADYLAPQEDTRARLEQEAMSGAPDLPTPIEPPVGRLAVQEAPAQEALKKETRENLSSNLAARQSSAVNKSKMAMSDSSQMAAGAAADMSTSESMRMAMPSAPVSSTVPYNEIMPYPQPQIEGNDKFEHFDVNPVKVVSAEPVSTFSIDVDTASYSFMRRQLNQGILPQSDSVRVEELVNYFDYNYQLPASKAEPFKPTVTVVPSPWANGKQLMHIAIKGYDVEDARPRANLVFLLDVSGSMDEQDKLPLVKNSMKMLLDTLQPNDTVAIAVYAGAAGTVLEPTRVSERHKILSALDNLNAGGSTAGAEGINLAYQLAERNFDKEAVNRVILATDGDFNVGVSSPDELKQIIERKRETGIFLSVLGFGQGNLNDHIMQELAQNGNGVAAHIDNLNEAQKVLVQEATSSLFPIAKDVKIQVEFNPSEVAEYRLIGYETRALNREDFNNDKIDAGDIGAGHAVTAIYEITPVGATPSVDPLRYGAADQAKPVEKAQMTSDFGGELAFVKIRYKLPNDNVSKLITQPVTKANVDNGNCPVCAVNEDCMPCVSGQAGSDDVRFSIAVAGFGQLLKNSPYVQNFTYDDVINMAQGAKGADQFGYRAEFINLVRLAKSTSGR